MKSFLDTWLFTLPGIVKRELSSRAELARAEHVPSPADAAVLALSIGAGRFTVAADLTALHDLLVEAGLVGPEPDRRRDYDLWCGLLREAATAAAQAFGEPGTASIEDAEWSADTPAAVYELCLGDVKVRLAFVDEVPPKARLGEVAAGAHTTKAEAESSASRPGIDLLLDVELEASLRFGSCEMSLNQVLELGPGDVVELDRHVADPVDLLVGDKIVARGEVVLVNGSFGLRVLEVAEPRKCLESIRCLF